jgi:hypothetical protein
MSESKIERGARLYPLAEDLAKRKNFTLPYHNEDSQSSRFGYSKEYHAGPFLLVTWRDDPTDFDDGHGCRKIGSSEWAENPEHVVTLARDALQWNGWRTLTVFDVERGEQCELEFGFRMKYKAVAELTAMVGSGCFDDSPSLGGSR